MLLLSLLAVMSGYSSLRGLESFMKRHPKEGAELFGLSRAKLPSYSTLRDMAMPVNAEDVTEMIQAHRGATENKLHWVKDVALGEDASQLHAANPATLMALLRSWAITLFRKAGHDSITKAI